MKRNPWPYAIIAYFAIFISGVVVWVAFAMRHNDQLVRADYYEQEIRYQDQIERVSRTAAVGSQVQVAYHSSAQTIAIQLPRHGAAKAIGGSIHLYRPSDAAMDQQLPLSLNADQAQRLDVSKLESGLWKIFLSWKAEGGEYYFEKPVILINPQPRPSP